MIVSDSAALQSQARAGARQLHFRIFGVLFILGHPHPPAPDGSPSRAPGPARGRAAAAESRSLFLLQAAQSKIMFPTVLSRQTSGAALDLFWEVPGPNSQESNLKRGGGGEARGGEVMWLWRCNLLGGGRRLGRGGMIGGGGAAAAAMQDTGLAYRLTDVPLALHAIE
jgi:hypothetical protein